MEADRGQGPDPETDRIKGLDGLRAFAALAVFLTHRTTLGNRLELGSMGLWLFFVLSGFLIIGILHRERIAIEAGTGAFRPALTAYLARRARRTFPVYYLALLTLVPLLVANGVIALDAHGFAMMCAYLTNVWIGTELLRWPHFVGHFWTLAVEEQFYLVAPFAALLLPARHLRAACLVVVAIGVATALWMTAGAAPEIAIRTNSFVNFTFVALGGLCRLSNGPTRTGRTSIVIVAALAGYAALNLAGNAFDTPLLLLLATPVLVALALVAIARNQAALAVRTLEWPPLAWFGRRSYGFYVFHSLVGLDALVPLLRAWGVPARLPETGAAAISFGMTLAAAALSYRFLEQPLMRAGRRRRS